MNLRFELYDSETGGGPLDSIDIAGVNVDRGLFTVELDFGSFGGEARWLQISVFQAKPPSWVVLSPRQKITPTPYALHALGGSTWTVSGSDIFYNAGRVGIGLDAPLFPLHVRGDVDRVLLAESTSTEIGAAALAGAASGSNSYGVLGEATTTSGTAAGGRFTAVSTGGKGVWATATATSGMGEGGRFESYSPGLSTSMWAAGVYARAHSTSGPAAWGVFGQTESAHATVGAGRGVFGLANATSGGGVGIYGKTNSPNGYAGYFEGPAHFTGNLTAGSLNASSLFTSSFRLPSGAVAGRVLTCDANGNGTWQAGAAALALPYSGSGTSTTAAFQATNAHASSGAGVRGTGAEYGLYGDSPAVGVYGYSSSGTGVRGSTNSGTALLGQSNSTGGVAVKGTTGSNPSATGGWFESGSATGRAVYALNASAAGGVAIVAQATGSGGIAILAESPNVGLHASGSTAAALYGKVQIYEQGTQNLVIELGKGLDYAEGFNVSTKDEQVGPGNVLVIDPANPGKLAISRQAYDRKVAGIVAGANGLGSGVRLGGDGFDHDVALAGRVYCRVIAGDEPIEPGDLLTTSDTAGHAMKAKDAARAPGAILGKAMEPLDAGQRGLILVLVTLQ